MLAAVKAEQVERYGFAFGCNDENLAGTLGHDGMGGLPVHAVHGIENNVGTLAICQCHDAFNWVDSFGVGCRCA